MTFTALILHEDAGKVAARIEPVEETALPAGEVCPIAPRRDAWARLVRDLPTNKLDAMTETAPLAALLELAGRVLKGEVRGRIVVDVNA
ncbi:MAG: hypothetical protein HY060_07565 [Proteobacteria bacterium]|nr:hypothetical protein [Pseudomonadota bacterium]